MEQRASSVWRGIMLALLIALAALSTACRGEVDPAEALDDSSSAAQESASQTSDSGQTPETEGARLFMDHCAKCHGPEGLGNGPSVGSLRTQSGLNLTILQEKNDEEILTTISTGKGTEMPPWGLVLTLAEREELLKHVRTLGSQ